MAKQRRQLKEEKLLEERATLIEDQIKANPELTKELASAVEADKRGEGVRAEDYFKKRGLT